MTRTPSKSGLRLEVLIVLSLILLSLGAGCGGSGMSTQPTQPPPPNAQVKVTNTIAGPMNLAMSTAFQPAEWDDQFFSLNPLSLIHI